VSGKRGFQAHRINARHRTVRHHAENNQHSQDKNDFFAKIRDLKRQKYFLEHANFI
jgi:hypothetical protein